ncbi:GNAT family N-acetyltransferase [Brevibacillus sp. GCM10020057]|uniref:GNAT family N-acetyltransferase n=1 Tax=Brevibacillus sp. GCM10020057 TaxID=3317327 RepID=UPI0036340917
MNLLSIVEKSDVAYKLVFSEREERPWGHLFRNEQNPHHYDANHAHISGPIAVREQAKAIVEEVIPYYAEKGIYPRLYLYDPPHQQVLVDELLQCGFRSEELSSPIQIWRGQLAEVRQISGITIEPVTEANRVECLQVESIPELGGKEVREKAFEREFAHPDFQHFLLRVEGQPASSLCLLQAGDVMRIENVATLPQFRGRGLIGHLIRHAQEQFLERGGSQLWVCPINERVEQVYGRYGFATVGVLPFLHVFRGGLAISEIR